VRHQPGELLGERALGQLDRFLEPRRHPRSLLLVQGGRELDEVIRRLDVGEVPGEAEQAHEGLGVVGGVVERAEPVGCGAPELAVVAIEVGDRIVELGAVVGHLGVEALDLIVLDQPDARLGERQGQTGSENHPKLQMLTRVAELVYDPKYGQWSRSPRS
jgi:hypothetical protein